MSCSGRCFRENIDKFEWYEVMPLTVISNKELDEVVKHVLDKIKDDTKDSFSEYVIKEINNYNPKLLQRSSKNLILKISSIYMQ